MYNSLFGAARTHADLAPRFSGNTDEKQRELNATAFSSRRSFCYEFARLRLTAAQRHPDFVEHAGSWFALIFCGRLSGLLPLWFDERLSDAIFVRNNHSAG